MFCVISCKLSLHTILKSYKFNSFKTSDGTLKNSQM